MMDSRTLEILYFLKEENVGFYIDIPGQHGGKTLSASAEDVYAFLSDKDKFCAKHYGITVQQFVAWCNSDRNVRCSAITQNGKRCKNNVVGGNGVDPATWVELQDGYCTLHSEGREI